MLELALEATRCPEAQSRSPRNQSRPTQDLTRCELQVPDSGWGSEDPKIEEPAAAKGITIICNQGEITKTENWNSKRQGLERKVRIYSNYQLAGIFLKNSSLLKKTLKGRLYFFLFEKVENPN